ncbi:S-adenosyl-L-methionine:benzoic acid/salicylic acid carboxyl methyltransferase 3-like [Dioscorea cayenensis subsp. rotundata]|uniref:S-adenosyl-L-methionine:benzoic acid/salicylic acid carboxyl methyltransferase 3-like n=1 Tax=Dioscorea cayennensis subsp. rotundata TaxID=55577 RepID=A0AB40D714_DIOCR|nr:S-adenosyl-L-methionine:benzoic acid/salicylic acid carboxyl methyltransferase 3-like [Dioscorea cayenensis subsp. rotundata]
MMKVEEALHMVGGAGDTSYASNSRLQEKAIRKTKDIVEKALKNINGEVVSKSLVVADLGCSSGPNAFLVISQIISAVMEAGYQKAKEIVFLLNDLPGNDFNTIFRSLSLYEKKVKEENGDQVLPYFVAGVPGSFYGRLFPCNSLHFAHSSYSLMWLSQVPVGIDHQNGGVNINKGNIYISRTSPPIVSRLYLEQFKRDFSSFLKLRSQELVNGGQMVLSFLGRKSSDPSKAEVCHLWGLVADALNSMVQEGVLEEEKVNTFNMPFYAASKEEVQQVIQSEGSFYIEQMQILESNWDPFDDSDDDQAFDNVKSGHNVAKCIRAVLEPLLVGHFGKQAIVDQVFARYAHNVAMHLLKEKTKHIVFILALKTKDLNL